MNLQRKPPLNFKFLVAISAVLLIALIVPFMLFSRSQQPLTVVEATPSVALDLPEVLGEAQNGDYLMISSELSPAALVAVRDREIALFSELYRWELGGPLHIAFATEEGVRTLHRPEASAMLELPAANLSEPWMLVWFNGSQGWENWDAPWLIVWQNRPERVWLNENGLHAQMRGPVGHVALMPLYGIYKPDTSGWSELPAETAERARYWSRALRHFPIRLDEQFRIDPKADAVVVRNRFEWYSTEDAWETEGLKFAPLSPTLALAYQSGRMPMRLSAELSDPEVTTAFGPYTGIEGVDSFEVYYEVLHYITEIEVEQQPNRSQPVVEAAYQRMLEAMTRAFTRSDGLFHQDFGTPENFEQPPPQVSDNGNTSYAVMSVQYYLRAIPYSPLELQVEAKERMRRYFADWVLQPGRYEPFKDKLLLRGPGIGTWGGYDDAGKFSSNALISIWAYGYYTGDWELIRERWDLIKKLFINPRETSWRSHGREEMAELGDQAGPPLALARMAYEVDDLETFAYAAYIFARELSHHVVKQTGAPYFVERQPRHNLQAMPDEVYLTDVWDNLAGWHIDGPSYPSRIEERQYQNRWVRFGDPSMARFYRENLMDLYREELDERLPVHRLIERPSIDDPHILPSVVRLRSLLLNEPPEVLARYGAMDAPAEALSGDIAFSTAFLRTSVPVRFKRLIPPERLATDWAQGIERDRPANKSNLTNQIEFYGAPTLTWWGWKPRPGDENWPFGLIATPRAIQGVQSIRLSWNTELFVLDLE